MRKAAIIIALVSLAVSGISCNANRNEIQDHEHSHDLLTADENSSLQNYQQRMAFKNKKAKALYGRGISLHEKGNNAGAKAELLKALKLEPENALVLTSLGHVCYAMQDYSEALDFYNRSHIMYDPEKLSEGVHLGRSYYLNGEYQKCIIISKYTAAHAKDEKSYFMSNYNLTKALIKTGQCEEAKNSFEDTKPALGMFKDLRSRIHLLEHELKNCSGSNI